MSEERSGEKTGAQALVQTLVDADVNVCFANPGTSEMHFVAALDSNPEMRCVLGLFEGIVTGAADGYGRMAGKPAVTLTHLGPGLANGLANVHNAKKACTPLVNVVGDHATYHRKFDAPLTSDVEALARPMSGWVQVAQSADEVSGLGAAAVQAALAPPGQVATLILPADTAWNSTSVQAAPLPRLTPVAPDGAAVDDAVKLLRSATRPVLLMNGVLTEERLALADRIAQATGAQVMCDTFVTRTQRGAGRAEPLRLPYFGEQAAEVLAGVDALVLVGTKAPVTFFAYPGKPSELTPEGCTVHQLVARDGDIDGALQALADAVGALSLAPRVVAYEPPGMPSGQLDPVKLGAVLGHLFPENAVFVDESATGGFGAVPATRTTHPHDWLQLTGGSIGYGLPCATGAAVACPDRPVICLQADGGGMYTVQALWTQAREQLDVTNIILNNGKYAILQVEFARVGAHNPGPKAMSMLDLTKPALNWVHLAQGMGMPGTRVTTVDEFARALGDALVTPGPALIEAMI